MNKKRLSFKHRKNTVRVITSPDYDHPAWESDVQPTPETVPDAFYRWNEPAYPRERTAQTRRKLHPSLSASKIKNRLHQAGLKGAEAKRVFAEIMSGDKTDDGLSMPMCWREKSFRNRFGRRVSRVVLRFVNVALIFADEYWSFMAPNMGSFVSEAMKTCRKVSAEPLLVTQTLPPPKNPAKRIYFRR